MSRQKNKALFIKQMLSNHFVKQSIYGTVVFFYLWVKFTCVTISS